MVANGAVDPREILSLGLVRDGELVRGDHPLVDEVPRDAAVLRDVERMQFLDSEEADLIGR